MKLPRHTSAFSLLLWTAAAHTQSPSPPPSPSATVELVREAVASFSEQAQAAHRFTFFELTRTQNKNEKGKLYFDRTVLTETTYIADLPFARVAEIDGKPLSGKALAEEQSRYDQAVRDRKALDAAARARVEKQHHIDARLPYSQLTTRFRLTELHTETTPSQTVHVNDAEPITSPHPLLPTEARHIKLSIATTAAGGPPHLLSADFDYLTDEGEVQRGSHGSLQFMPIDGVDVPSHSEIHSIVVVAGSSKPIQVDVDRTRSRYRQFASTTQILPSAPPSNAPSSAPK